MSAAGSAKLILVKHSLPEIEPSVPAPRWRLSAEGRLRCLLLARRLAAYAPEWLVSSTEAKAAETAQIAARELGLGISVGEGLHEHMRTGLGWKTQEELERGVRSLFDHPGELVMGKETADQAHARFAAAVGIQLAAHRGRTGAIVAHGTVISLYVARIAGLEPMVLWKRLGLPSFAVVSIPDLELLEVAESL